mmetsp:Transcript_25329/g.38941  ORF Transcript_25329/g.38941 Transcript_25329/m.38941 type:complete len:104 (-) Transcript_25329:102-413(-)
MEQQEQEEFGVSLPGGEEEEEEQENPSIILQEKEQPNLLSSLQFLDQREDERRLLGSTLQRRYISALNEAFKDSSLSGAVTVKQIQCSHFLDKTLAAYIRSFS